MTGSALPIRNAQASPARTAGRPSRIADVANIEFSLCLAQMCPHVICGERSEEAIQLLLLAAMDCFRLRSSSYSGQVASLAMTIWAELPRALIERLAQRDIALLLLRPVAAAGDGAIDHQIMPVDKTRFVAGEKHRGMGDVFRQPGARDRLRGLVDLAHHIGGLLRGLDRQAECLAENAGGDRARRDRVDADAGLAELHRHAFGKMNEGGLGGALTT